MRAKTIGMIFIALLLLHDIGCMPSPEAASAGRGRKQRQQLRTPWGELRHAMDLLQALEEAPDGRSYTTKKSSTYIEEKVGQRTITGDLVMFFTRSLVKSFVIAFTVAVLFVLIRPGPDGFNTTGVSKTRIVKAVVLFFFVLILSRIMFSNFISLAVKRPVLDISQLGKSVCQLTFEEDVKQDNCNFEPYETLGLQQEIQLRHEFDMFIDAIDMTHPEADKVVRELSDDIVLNNPVEQGLKMMVEGNVAFLCKSRTSQCSDTGVLIDEVPAVLGTDPDCPFLLAVHGKGEEYGLVGKWSYVVQVGMELDPQIFHGKSQFIGAAVALCMRVASEGAGGTHFVHRSAEAEELLQSYSFAIRKSAFPEALQLMKDRYMMVKRPVRTHLKPNPFAGVKSGVTPLPGKRLQRSPTKEEIGTFLATGTSADGTALKITMFRYNVTSRSEYKYTQLGSKFAEQAVASGQDSEMWLEGALRGSWWCAIMNWKIELDKYECSSSQDGGDAECLRHHSALKLIENFESESSMAHVKTYHKELKALSKSKWKDRNKLTGTGFEPNPEDPRWLSVELKPFFNKLIDPDDKRYGRGTSTWDRLVEWDVWLRAQHGVLSNGDERRPFYRFARNDQPPKAYGEEDAYLLENLQRIRKEEQDVQDRLDSKAEKEMLFPFKYVAAMDDLIDHHCLLDEDRGIFLSRHEQLLREVPLYAPLNAKVMVNPTMESYDKKTHSIEHNENSSPLFKLHNLPLDRVKATRGVIDVMVKPLDANSKAVLGVPEGQSYADLQNQFPFHNLLSAIVRAQMCGAEANVVYRDAAIIAGLTGHMGYVLQKHKLPDWLDGYGNTPSVLGLDLGMTRSQQGILYRNGAYTHSFISFFSLFFALSAVWSLAKRKHGTIVSRQDREYIAYTILGMSVTPDMQYYRNRQEIEYIIETIQEAEEPEDLIPLLTIEYIVGKKLGNILLSKQAAKYIATVAKAAISMLTDPPSVVLPRYGLAPLPLM